MAYTRGNSSQIVVGAAALFVHDGGPIDNTVTLPDYVAGTSYKTTLSSETSFRNVGYTSNGLELTFQPDFGEVKVDQILDVAKLYKQGMKVELKTSFAEATLENLLLAVAAKSADLTTNVGDKTETLDMKSGDLGDYPLERGLVAVGASVQNDPTGTSEATDTTAVAGGVERIYQAYRALSIQNVTVNAKRDAATEFEVTFRLLPNGDASYGKIVDRVIGTAL